MRKPARPITAKYLQNAATFYLERYPSTAEGLRRVLNRRVAKAKMLEAPIMDNVQQAISVIVQKFVDAGMMRRVPLPEHSARYEYVLTEKGRDFFPAYLALKKWGDDWLAEVRRYARSSVLDLLADDTQVEFGRVHDDVVVLGASALLMEQQLGLGLVR